VRHGSGLLADLEARTDSGGSALECVEAGLALAKETGNRRDGAYLYRLRGDILLKLEPAYAGSAQDSFETAVALAKEQGARAYQLFAALSRGKLYHSTARPAQAHAVLAPALEGFVPTPEMAEIAEATALLSRLA
jgi:hypothetical protein